MRKAHRYRLSDLVTFVSGGTPNKQEQAFWGGQTPWVSAKDLKSLRISHSIDTLSQAGRQESSLVPPGTLLVLVRGMSLFKKIPLGVSMRELAINQDIKGLVPKESISPFFLAYSLLSMETELLQMVEAAGHGTGRLDTESLKDLSIWLPERKFQDVVVDILSTWDTAIEKTEKISEKRSECLNSLITCFYATNDRAGIVFPFGHFLKESTIPGSSGARANKLTVKLYGKGVVPKETKRIGSDNTKYFVRRSGQLIFSKLDFLNGAFGIIPPELDGYESTLDLPAFDISSEIDPGWLIGYLTRPHYYTRQVGLARGQRKARRVHPSDFLASQICVPPLTHQRKIAEALTAAKMELEVTGQILKSLRLQKRGLMQKLITGQWQLPADLPEVTK